MIERVDGIGEVLDEIHVWEDGITNQEWIEGDIVIVVLLANDLARD